VTTEMGEQQANLHRQSIKVVRRRERVARELASGRGREVPLFGPNDGSPLDMHLIELDPGSTAGRHHVHTKSECIYMILSGAISLGYDSGRIRLGPGDTALVPPGVGHSATVIGKRRALLLEIYSSAPADFVIVDEPVHRSGRS
jgi:mannose-6-phosphate isomerase-like protein (cupin superfamily)